VDVWTSRTSVAIAKRVEYRLAKSFDERPKDSISKKGSEEDVQEKMKSYLRLCKKPTSPMVAQSSRVGTG
jgi:hypothetical protein